MKKKMYTQEEVASMVKSLKDFHEQKNDSERMSRVGSVWWALRSVSVKIHYWLMAFCFPVAILLWGVTGDFWKGLLFLVYAEMYHLGANFRGFTLHLENLIEWVMKKTV